MYSVKLKSKLENAILTLTLTLTLILTLTLPLTLTQALTLTLALTLLSFLKIESETCPGQLSFHQFNTTSSTVFI